MDTNKKLAPERARNLYFHGKLKEALDIYLPLAKSGDVESQVFVGWLYSKGCKSVGKDLKIAKKWLEPAAELGYSAAYYQLGKMYFTGMHVEKNVGLAHEYFNNASKLGHIFAKREIALMKIKGYEGVRRD